jgi:hypothetical protein
MYYNDLPMLTIAARGLDSVIHFAKRMVVFERKYKETSVVTLVCALT